jgi:hypothetical protein
LQITCGCISDSCVWQAFEAYGIMSLAGINSWHQYDVALRKSLKPRDPGRQYDDALRKSLKPRVPEEAKDVQYLAAKSSHIKK